MSWLLDNLFIRPSVNVLLGPLASKKSWLGLDLAASVAADGSWLGHPGQRSPTMFVDKALGTNELQRRVRSLLSARGSSFNFPFCFYSNFTPFTDPEEMAYLLSQANLLSLGLVVIDSPFFLSLYLNRHKLHALSPILESLRDLALSANAAILLIHDLSKHRTDLAAPLLAMGVDHVLAVESQERNPVVHLRTLASAHQQTISILTQPGIMGFKPIPKFHSPPTTLGLAGFELIRHLLFLGQATTAQLMASVRSAVPTRVRTLIHEMVTAGYIHRTNPGGSGSPAIYALTPAGRALLREL